MSKRIVRDPRHVPSSVRCGGRGQYSVAVIGFTGRQWVNSDKSQKPRHTGDGGCHADDRSRPAPGRRERPRVHGAFLMFPVVPRVVLGFGPKRYSGDEPSKIHLHRKKRLSNSDLPNFSTIWGSLEPILPAAPAPIGRVSPPAILSVSLR